MIPAGPKGYLYLRWLSTQPIPEQWGRLPIMPPELRETDFTPRLHPRNRRGEFVDTPDIGSRIVDALNPHLHDDDLDDAVEHYADHWDRLMNGKLRGLDTDPAQADQIDRLITNMDGAIATRGTEVKGKLYRGFDAADANESVKRAIETNGSFADAGYSSTTSNLQVARNFARQAIHPKEPVMMEVRVAPGTKALHYSRLLENERILPRGGSYKVIESHDWTQFGHTVKWVTAEWSPPGG